MWRASATASRRRPRPALLKHFRGLERSSCPFHNLPESRKGQWGEGLTADDMEQVPVA